MTDGKMKLIYMLRKENIRDLADEMERNECHCSRCVNNGVFDCPEQRIPELKSCGSHHFGDDETSGINYWIFKKGTEGEIIREYLQKQGVSFEGVGIDSKYDCTGKFFSCQVDILRKGSRVLVTQRWGIDV